MKGLGKRLKSKRLSKDLSQKNIADLLKIERATYTCWEIEKHSPSLDDLVKLADIFETSTDYLLGRYQESRDQQ